MRHVPQAALQCRRRCTSLCPVPEGVHRTVGARSRIRCSTRRVHFHPFQGANPRMGEVFGSNTKFFSRPTSMDECCEYFRKYTTTLLYLNFCLLLCYYDYSFFFFYFSL
uniref:Uncharacterized protein n=1 Tax=Anopheles merus TaxID=30066 RepID=A0A182UXK4_ANOME